MLNKQFNLTGEKRVPDNWSGFAFSEDSSLSKNLSNSKEIQNWMRFKYIMNGNKFKNNQVEIKFSEPNFHLAYGGATILNPKVQNGYFTGVLFDKYDFKLKTPSSWLDAVNNVAFLMGLDRKYYILVPVKFRW